MKCLTKNSVINYPNDAFASFFLKRKLNEEALFGVAVVVPVGVELAVGELDGVAVGVPEGDAVGVLLGLAVGVPLGVAVECRVSKYDKWGRN